MLNDGQAAVQQVKKAYYSVCVCNDMFYFTRLTRQISIKVYNITSKSVLTFRHCCFNYVTEY